MRHCRRQPVSDWPHKTSHGSFPTKNWFWRLDGLGTATTNKYWSYLTCSCCCHQGDAHLRRRDMKFMSCHKNTLEMLAIIVTSGNKNWLCHTHRSHLREPQWFQYSPKIIDSKISENNTMVKNTKMLENYLVSDPKKQKTRFGTKIPPNGGIYV